MTVAGEYSDLSLPTTLIFASPSLPTSAMNRTPDTLNQRGLVGRVYEALVSAMFVGGRFVGFQCGCWVEALVFIECPGV